MIRLAALLVCCVVVSAAQEARPYKDGRGLPSTFEGPGRELPGPEDLREILIGYYGPADDSHPEGGVLWQGATLAVEEANREGGYQGKPFRLVSRWSENPWRGGAALISRMALVDRVWAVIGSIEGAGTHLAEQVVVKAFVPLVNPVATDRSIHTAGVPWMFSIVQGDDRHSVALAGGLSGQAIVILSATDHDSRAFCGKLKSACARAKVNIKLHLEFDPGRPELSELVRNAVNARPGAIAVVAGMRDSARVVKLVRGERFEGLIAGSPLFGRTAFSDQAGAADEGALFPWVGEAAPAFRDSFIRRFGNRPDYAAACAYDSVRIVVAGIRKAGLNRARIRDALAALPPYEGASGRIEWDEFGQNRRPPVLAVIRSGRAVPAARALR
ncbi:MAG TPA: ABC transporter substrate-binding protein [Bryobacteraceae bacterium]|nr:ABC transporter substrate-binding protein [Bryobacteraceae bacterium]